MLQYVLTQSREFLIRSVGNLDRRVTSIYRGPPSTTYPGRTFGEVRM